MTIIPEELQIHEPDENLLEIINSRVFNDKILFETQSDFHSVKVVENEVGRFLHYKDTYQAGYIKTKSYTGNLPYINYFTIPFLINPKVKNILLKAVRIKTAEVNFIVAAFFLCPLEIELSGSTHCLLKKVFQLRSAGRSLVERKRERPFRESPDRITLFMPLHFFVNLGVEFELCAVDRIVLDV